jgi:hypothetical protein
MGQMFIDQFGCTTFDPYRVARVLKPRFCYKHLTHSGSISRYKYAKNRDFKDINKLILQYINSNERSSRLRKLQGFRKRFTTYK